MGQLQITDQPKILKDLVDGLAQATGACSQLIHLRKDPRWMVIREALELTQEGVMSVATFAANKITSIKPR